MKVLLDMEDAIIGAVMGLLVIGMSGRFFSLELNPIFYMVGFGALMVFIILDLVNEIFNLGSHPLYLLILILHNIIDFIISAAFISKFTGYNIPFITESMVPFLDDPRFLFYIGAFMVVANGLWIVTVPFHSE